MYLRGIDKTRGFKGMDERTINEGTWNKRN